MRFICIAIFCVITVGGYAQSKTYPFLFSISDASHTSYYERALQLSSSTDLDSLKTGLKILKSLRAYDTLQYSFDRLRPFAQQISDRSYKIASEKIIGEWQLIWSGTNWGTDYTDKDTNMKVIFTANRFSFYVNDKLVRSTAYSVVEPRYYEPKYLYYYAHTKDILFEDNGEKWSMFFYPLYAWYEISDEKEVVTFKVVDNCVCGCGEDTYRRIK